MPSRRSAPLHHTWHAARAPCIPPETGATSFAQPKFSQSSAKARSHAPRGNALPALRAPAPHMAHRACTLHSAGASPLLRSTPTQSTTSLHRSFTGCAYHRSSRRRRSQNARERGSLTKHPFEPVVAVGRPGRRSHRAGLWRRCRPAANGITWSCVIRC
jgi:hypothetical protein